MRLIGLILYASLLSSIAGNHTNAQEKKVRFSLKTDGASVLSDEFRETMDIPGFSVENKSLDIIASKEYFERFKGMGFDVTLLETQRSGPDAAYLNHDEIAQIINSLSSQYPDIIHVKKIGESLMGRPIYAVRLTAPENIQAKPAVLFNSMHHAREIMTPEVTVDLMIYLATNYNNLEKPWVNEWLENLSIWIVPQVNPDGNKIVWEQDSWWRKNGRAENNRPYGVDLNRNYPYEWGACNGSSGNRSSATFRGDSAGSEPETQALMNFITSENILLDISYHSYSELVIAPYGCQGSYTPEKGVVDEIGQKLASVLERDNGSPGYTYGTGWEILYPVDGDDISWMYQENNTIAYVIEVNSSSQGFQPSYEKWREKTVERQRRGWKYLLHRAMKGPQVRGRITDALTGKPIDGNLKIANVEYHKEKARRSKDGVFYKLLAPGSYDLVFEATGYEPQTISISIGDSPVMWDVAMMPTSLGNKWGF